MTPAIPIAIPVISRAITKVVKLIETAAPMALIVKRMAAVRMAVFRPILVVSLVAINEPSTIEANIAPKGSALARKPSAATSKWKFSMRVGRIPAITPSSNPKSRPEIAAMLAIR